MALIQCALAHAVRDGCQPIMTPFFMRQDAMAACAQLDDFDEQLYKVSGAPRTLTALPERAPSQQLPQVPAAWHAPGHLL